MKSLANYPKKLLEEIYSFYENDEFCDVTLVAGETKLKLSAHRLILSAASTYFRSMFTGNFKERNLSEIPLPEVNGEQLKILIHFCYTGVIDITENNVYDILKVASPLGFTYIEAQCGEFLKQNLNASSSLSIWTLVEQYMNFKDIVEMAINYAKVNFLEVTETDEFLELDSNRLLRLLKSDDINVWSEEDVFNALIIWVNYDEETREAYVHELLSAVRFAQLKPNFIYENVEQFCKKFNTTDLIEDVYKWVLLPHTQSKPTEPRPSTAVKRLIAIGCIQNKKILPTEIYCPIANKWRVYEKFVCERSEFCSVIVNDDLYVFGGTDQDRDPLTSVQKFNFTKREVSEIEPMDSDRLNSAAAVLNDYIYVAGGDDLNLDLNPVSRFNLKTGKWSNAAPMLQQRSMFGLASLNGRLFASGGYGQLKRLNSVERYDPFENQWENVSSMLQCRSGHSLVIHSNRIYAIGGIRDMCYEDFVEYYDPVINSWTLIYSQPTVPLLQEMGATVIDDLLYIAGGVDNEDNIRSSVIRINLGTDKEVVASFNKEIMAPMNFSRSSFSLFELPCYN